jgi:hypothetical protein
VAIRRILDVYGSSALIQINARMAGWPAPRSERVHVDSGANDRCGVDLRRFLAGGTVSQLRLAQVSSADLHVPILVQLAPAQLPLGDALKTGPLDVVRLDAPFRGRPLR